MANNYENDSEKRKHPTTIKLIELLEATTSRALAFYHCDEFVEAYKGLFKTPYKCLEGKQHPPLAGSSIEGKKVRDMLINIVKAEMKKEIECFLEDCDVEKSFRLLDKLKTENLHVPPSKKAWRPPGNAKKHMERFYLASQVNERNQLVRQLAQEREKLNLLKDRMEKTRKIAKDMDESVKDSMEQLTLDAAVKLD